MRTNKRGNTLEKWEIALIKTMLNLDNYNDQDILAHFTRPTRSINHARIIEIRTGKKFKTLKPASAEDLNEFLINWPDVDAETGLALRGDELLIKAREAMIAAVHTFNGAGMTFRAELFIVTSIIAWTYLLHAWFQRKRIVYLYRNKDGTARKTKNGADRHWELGSCLRQNRCPLSKGVIKNLEFVLELRHEIEHRSTNSIDNAVSTKLQACCLNFNDAIKELFGSQYGLERRLPVALQFVTFSADQRADLKKGSNLPAHIEAFIDAFEHCLTKEEYADPAYQYKVAFVPISGSRASSSDEVVEFVKGDSNEGREINRTLLKETDKRRYTAKKVLKLMWVEGYPKFKQHAHTSLWKKLGAKNLAKGYGRAGDYNGTWVWYDKWIECVRDHCLKQGERYK